MIVVFGEIVFTDEEIMILVELPELAVDHVEVFVRKVIHHLVNVVFIVQQRKCLNGT